MITQERLEEMIKHKEIIYAINGAYKYSIPLGISNVNINGNSVEIKDKSSREYLFKLENLIDNKEDFDFLCNYQNITRTETLSLPTWDEIQKIKYYEFFVKDYDYMLQYQPVSKKIALYDMNNRGDYYLEEATKDNYLQACEICKKLFLGEEVEDE